MWTLQSYFHLEKDVEIEEIGSVSLTQTSQMEILSIFFFKKSIISYKKKLMDTKRWKRFGFLFSNNHNKLELNLNIHVSVPILHYFTVRSILECCIWNMFGTRFVFEVVWNTISVWWIIWSSSLVYLMKSLSVGASCRINPRR